MSSYEKRTFDVAGSEPNGLGGVGNLGFRILKIWGFIFEGGEWGFSIGGCFYSKSFFFFKKTKMQLRSPIILNLQFWMLYFKKNAILTLTF